MKTNRNIKSEIKCDFISKKVIATSRNNNTWFGTIKEKKGCEVLLVNARHMHSFMNIGDRGLSSAATTGIDPRKSRITGRVDQVWIDAAEIILCSEPAVLSIEKAPVLN
jgi:hypothetical protein